MATSKTETPHPDRVLIDFALQGGGAHGAFTWGALDRLLAEPWLQIDGISGTSAGAMNAAVLVDGHAKGGADAARSALESFWRSVSHSFAEPAASGVSRYSPRPLELGPFAGFCRDGHDGAGILAL